MRTMPMGPYPVEVSLCLSEQDWNKSLAKYWQQAGGEPQPWPKEQRSSVEPFTYKDGALWLVVAVSAQFREHPISDRIGVIAHEATHLWQFVREHCGILNVDHEIEAHAVGWYTSWLYEQLHSEGWLKT